MTYVYTCRACGHSYELPEVRDLAACNEMIAIEGGGERRCWGSVRRDYRAEAVNIDKRGLH